MQLPLPPHIIFEENEVDALEFSTHRGTRGHPLKLSDPDPCVSVRARCFSIRVIVLWNRLPASAVLAENIQMFKKLLKRVDFSCAMSGKARH